MRENTAAALVLAFAQKQVSKLDVPAGAPGPAGADGRDGVDGAPGPAGADGIGFAMVGRFEEGRLYYGPSDSKRFYQVVEYQGSSYAATDPNGVAGRPPGSGWALLASKGTKGDRGYGGGGGAVLPELGTLAYVTPTGTPDGTKFLRDDNTWAAVPGASSSFNYIDFAASPGVSGQPRRLMWNATDGTLDLGMNNGSVTQQIGLEQFYRVKASSAITNGQCVMFTGTQGNSGVLLAAPVSGTPDPNYIMGIATEDITLNDTGFVTSFGKVRGVQTNGANHGETWVDGTVLYANPSAAGHMTSVRPDVDPVIVAVVVSAHGSNGEYFVRLSHDGVRWDRISGKPTLSYTTAFNSTTDWSGSGPYTISIPQTTHLCGTALGVTVFKDNGDGTETLIASGIDDLGMVVTKVTTATGDVLLTATTRFAGRLVLTRTSGTGSTGVNHPITTVTTATTLTAAHYTVLVDASGGDVSITLPDALGALNRVYNVKKIDASINDVVIVGTVDGAADKRIGTQYTTVTVQSNGTAWWII